MFGNRFKLRIGKSISYRGTLFVMSVTAWVIVMMIHYI